MDTTQRARPVPLYLTALVAFFSALAALAVTNGHDAHAHGDRHATPVTTTAGSAATISVAAAELRTGMRKLWEDHVTWTRLAVVSLTGDTPDTDATVARLLRNQVDIGNAIKPFYGKAAGNRLTADLRKHIVIAAEVIAAAKAGDEAALAAAQARWSANGDDIAALLSSVNPSSWKLPTMRAELRTHLRLTTDEVVARLQGRWAADVAAYDKIHEHALHIADVLSAGLVAQFPKRFR